LFPPTVQTERDKTLKFPIPFNPDTKAAGSLCAAPYEIKRWVKMSFKKVRDKAGSSDVKIRHTIGHQKKSLGQLAGFWDNLRRLYAWNLMRFPQNFRRFLKK
jgi:hypothetical protein